MSTVTEIAVNGSNESVRLLGVPLGSVIHDGDTPNLHEVRFRLEAAANTTAGRIIAVPMISNAMEDSCLLCRVDNLFEVNPHEDAIGATVSAVIPIETRYALEGESTVIYRTARAEVLEEVILNSAGGVVGTRSPESIARAGTIVFEAPEHLVSAAFGFVSEPALALEMGEVLGSGVPANLDRGVVQRHILIVGGIGSGKSWTRGVLAEELASHGVAQVNIDVNGEMVDAVTELGGKNLRPVPTEFTLPLSALTGNDVIDAIPAVNRGTNIETLIHYSQEELIKDYVQRRGVHFGVEELCAQIEASAPPLEMKANTWRPAQARARSLERLPYIGGPFDWASELRPGAFVNLDCRGILVSDLRLITAAVARDLQRVLRTGELPFVVLSIDEFHLVAPQGESIVTTQVLRELARMGRHLRIGLVLTTQSPGDVDRPILKRLMTRFLHAIEPDQLDALRGVFSDASEDLVKAMPKMPIGRCVLTGSFETVKHAAVIDVRRRKTTHGGGSPPIWDDLAKAGWTNKKSIDEIMGDVADGS